MAKKSDLKLRSVMMHRKYKGKLATSCKVPLKSRADLSIWYTPGVAAVCEKIATDRDESFELTNRGNTVAVVTDGSAVLGLGNIGAYAALPVMEGKCILFKRFAGLDAVPVCLDCQDPEKLVEMIAALEPNFAGINLEDISSPRCFYIEEELKKKLSIPVIHDDQHATAIVTLAAMINALKITGRKRGDLRVVCSGAGAAGMTVMKLLLSYGIRRISAFDSRGPIYPGRKANNPYLDEFSASLECGYDSLSQALSGADAFIGLSAAGLVKPADIRSMNRSSIVFAMANPVPEIMPEDAKSAGACIVASGRSDYPNQINNVLVFPGLFAGMIRTGTKKLTEKIKIRVAEQIAGLVPESRLSRGIVVPGVFNRRLVDSIRAGIEAA
ncbi:MAG: NADP-dependent malic enzyme [Candidatus Wallbacteria bacterium]|nr:NADP-dependent malic enzyme [Candidatus Wallbacteria bacterium]